MPDDNSRPADDRGSEGPPMGAAALLRQIELESPFSSGGRLSRKIVGLLRTLDTESLGRAVTSLLRHAVALSPMAGSQAATTIEDLLDGGIGGQVPVQLEVAALVEIYRELLVDTSRRAISGLIVRLLRTADRAEIFASIGVDAASLDFRVSLMEALDGPFGGEAGGESAPPDAGEPTRGMVFPTRSAEPPMDVTDGRGDGGGSTKDDEGTVSPGAQRRTYRAYGLLESDETVLVARPFPLKVGLSPSAPPGVAGPPLELPRPDAKPYALDIQLFADGFDLGPGESWRHNLEVAPGDLYPTFIVHLTARDLPEPKAIRSITATFSIDGETLGAAMRQIIVTTDPDAIELAAPSSTATGANIAAPTGLPPADITITIKRGLEQGALQWGIESSLPGIGLPHDRPADSDIGDDPKEFATAIIRKLFVQGHQLGVFQLLQGIGKTIRDEMPTPVRAALKAANKAVAPRTLDILLLTEEPFIPWELAWIDEPFDKTAPPYLGAQANIGRWVLEPDSTPTDPPRTLDAATIAVVWGVYKSSGLRRLKAAEDEAKQIQDQYQAVSIDARPNLVYPLLAGNPPSDILHFAVHGRYNPQGVDEGIYLVEGPPIDPFQIRGSDLSKRAPFVFLNACQVGAAQNLLGNYAGIAQAFLKIGASGVVAPLWSIDDTIAQQIALEFYKHALEPAKAADGDSGAEGAERPAVADLLRRARAGLVKDPAAHSSTYLAYQFYGHPSLRLSWKPSAAAGGP
jgi:hypothetical protein